MTDDTLETNSISPLKSTAPVIRDVAPAAAVEPTTADKLRAFEDEVFGKNVSRINGEVERGIGSPYAAMTEHQKVHYAALEQLASAEKSLADASAALAAAQAAHDAATKAAAVAAKANADAE